MDQPCLVFGDTNRFIVKQMNDFPNWSGTSRISTYYVSLLYTPILLYYRTNSKQTCLWTYSLIRYVPSFYTNTTCSVYCQKSKRPYHWNQSICRPYISNSYRRLPSLKLRTVRTRNKWRLGAANRYKLCATCWFPKKNTWYTLGCHLFKLTVTTEPLSVSKELKHILWTECKSCQNTSVHKELIFFRSKAYIVNGDSPYVCGAILCNGKSASCQRSPQGSDPRLEPIA